jgi:uncharacterized protein (TIGR03083 family)
VAEEIVDLLAAEWATLTELGRSLTEPAWDLPTELPGWSVRDNFSHVIGTERMLLGESPPEGFDDAAKAPHVKNPIAEVNERWVAARRHLSGREILDELVDVSTRRLTALSSMSESDFAKEGWSPIGQVPYREFMRIRLMDTWAHEQDIRRAVGKPGHEDGPIAESCLDRIVPVLPRIVAKSAGAPQGSSVTFVIDGPLHRTVTVSVDNGRGMLSPDHAQPDCTLIMSSETFFCISWGRWDPERVLEGADIAISGDKELGHRVVRSLPLMI